MICLISNQSEFYNDLCDVIRLFLQDEIIACGEADPEAGAEVRLDVKRSGEEYTAFARLTMGGKSCENTCSANIEAQSSIREKRFRKRLCKITLFRCMRQMLKKELPWGSLTGIRPTRLYSELVSELGTDGADGLMLNDFDVSQKKLALVKSISKVQKEVFAQQTPEDIDVYIGIPYCFSRCLYCSFASEVRTKKTDMKAYLDALKKDIEAGANTVRSGGYNLRSVYIGGGTPTVLNAEELFSLLEHIKNCYGTDMREYTVEAGRPDTIDEEKLRVIKSFDIGRISINPQSMNADTLRLIGRNHTPEQISEAYLLARQIGFDCINMDIIAGLPGEDAAAFERTVDGIKDFKPDNFTVHTLAIKRSSLLNRRIADYPLPGAEEVAEMVELGAQAAMGMGLRAYYMYRQKYMSGNLENVGYARAGTECLYNVDIMEETTNIIAHGAGGISKRVYGGELRVERVPNPKDIGTYIQKLDVLLEKRRIFFVAV